MMSALSAILALLTTDQWIKLIVALPSLLEAARKVDEDIHPVLLRLESILDQSKAQGLAEADAQVRAAKTMHAWAARNADAAIRLEEAMGSEG